jgi:hypothetical protein
MSRSVLTMSPQSMIPTQSELFLGYFCVTPTRIVPESIEWFIEDQAFLLSYGGLAPASPPNIGRLRRRDNLLTGRQESLVLSQSAVSIWNNIFPKWNYKISLVQETHISRLEVQRWFLEFVISFFKVYIWDWGKRLANSFLDYVIQILIRQMHFLYIFFQLWKVKNLCGNILFLQQILTIFSRISYVCPIWIFIFDTV